MSRIEENNVKKVKMDEVLEVPDTDEVFRKTGSLEQLRAKRFAEMADGMKLHSDGKLGREGFSAEHLEWIRNDAEICKLSIGRDGSTLLLLAANLDCAQMLEELLATGACDAKAIDSDGFSSLMLAAMADDESVSERMARALIPHCSMRGRKAEVTRGGTQDVHFALIDGNVRTAKLLGEARGGGDLSAEGPLSTNSWGENWLHLALRSKMQGEALAWVLSLPSARLMFNSKNTDGETPLDVAIKREAQWPWREAVAQLKAARAGWERDDLSQDVSIGGGLGRKGVGRL